MRTATLCTLCATLAAVSSSCEQVDAATLAVHTNVPVVKVHVPPPKVTVSPKVQVHNLTIKGDNSQSLKTTSAQPFDKNNGDKGKGGKTKTSGGLINLNGVEGESQDSHHSPNITSY